MEVQFTKAESSMPTSASPALSGLGCEQRDAKVFFIKPHRHMDIRVRQVKGKNMVQAKDAGTRLLLLQHRQLVLQEIGVSQ